MPSLLHCIKVQPKKGKSLKSRRIWHLRKQKSYYYSHPCCRGHHPSHRCSVGTIICDLLYLGHCGLLSGHCTAIAQIKKIAKKSYWLKVSSYPSYNDTVTYPLPMFLQKRMQHVPNAAAGFVLNCYCTEKNILKLGWLPTL